MTAIAIVEPHRMTRLGVEHAVKAGPAIQVVASVASLAELVLDSCQPDVVVLSEAACGNELGNAVQSLRGQAHVLMLVRTCTPVELHLSLQAGAKGFVTLDVENAELGAAIRAVANGAFYLMACLTDQLRGKPDPFHDERVAGDERRSSEDHADRVLAPREVETLRFVASGYTHGQIARRMGLTEMTINTYVKRIRAKLNAGNKAELTRKAIELGYLGTGRHSLLTESGLQGSTAFLAQTA